MRMENAQRMLLAGTVVPQNKIQLELIAPPAGFYDWIVGNGCGYSVRITPGLWMRDKVMEVYAKVPKDLDEEQDGDLKYIRNIVREAADRAYGTGETGKKT